ncbi:hypothetical protein [Pedosphaera parvula]|uniref:Uncharacterized protein n=1 Tax=Pedosphaera parvula (strain Ellin514) TaxID=320771 RepID=B9XI10_PEDPL|nr:hypothetical protein [Pedosphaera parvula]EEF60503.1 hypothetical protein Cflav_PD3473 [Pedosphaera parvula Ellin514]
MENDSQFVRQQVATTALPMQVVCKWTRPLLDEGYVPFPKKLVRCLHRLFTDANAAKDLAVILAVVDYHRPKLSRNPSIEYLSFLAGLEVAEFEASLSRLEERGFVRVVVIRDELGGVEISYAGLLAEIDKLTRGDAQ